jgi:hypothetical protein
MEAGAPGDELPASAGSRDLHAGRWLWDVRAKAEGFAPSDADISGLPGKAGAAADPDDRPAADRHLSSISRLTVEVETRRCKSRRRFRRRSGFVIVTNA